MNASPFVMWLTTVVRGVQYLVAIPALACIGYFYHRKVRSRASLVIFLGSALYSASSLTFYAFSLGWLRGFLKVLHPLGVIISLSFDLLVIGLAMITFPINESRNTPEGPAGDART